MESSSGFKHEVLIRNRTTQALFKVIVHNDDFTPIEFVILMLQQIFQMERQKAVTATLEAHCAGKVACGVFTKEVAESKISQVIACAREHQHPLSCTMEAV